MTDDTQNYDLELENETQEFELNLNDDTSKYLGLEFENEIDVINTGSSAKVYDGVLTLSQNGEQVAQFSANSATDVTCNFDLSDYATLASPALTGTPTAPTATAGDSSTNIATTAFVTDAINTAITEVENGNY